MPSSGPCPEPSRSVTSPRHHVHQDPTAQEADPQTRRDFTPRERWPPEPASTETCRRSQKRSAEVGSGAVTPMGTAIRRIRQDGRLGFYGCAKAGESRVIRVAWQGEGRAPRSADVECPVCDKRHRVEPIWRKATELDEGRKPDITLRN